MTFLVNEFGSEFDWESNQPYLKKENEESSFLPNESYLCYRSGRDALKAVAIRYKEEKKYVLLPALCCESMVSPFLINGYIPVFYKLNADYTADVTDVKEKLRPDCIFLYMSYFGINPFSDDILIELKNNNSTVVFLEDCTQNALHLKAQKKSYADITVISIRKWFAIPDGGILQSKFVLQKEAVRDALFYQLRIQALKLKSEYLRSGKSALKEKYRELLQQASELLDESAVPCDISLASLDLLQKMDFNKILKARQKNVATLKTYLDGLVLNNKIKYITANPEDSTLYFPILTTNRDKIQKLLAQENIYCPVIWPIPKQAEGVCVIAEYTADHMLGIPCDHRYTKNDMEFIAKKIAKLLQA